MTARLRALARGAAAAALVAVGIHAAPAEPLPELGPAADFTLTDQSGAPFHMADLRGRVALVSFMFTQCPDVCPVLTTKLSDLQAELGALYPEEVRFVSITVDPETDSPEVLRDYAEALAYDPDGWVFLTGQRDEVAGVARAYGVLMAKDSQQVRHSLLSTIVDREGMMRVQYLGERFEPADLLADLRAVAAEP